MNGLDCHRCTEQLQEVRGCHGFEPRMIGDIEIRGCPAKAVTAESWELWEAFDFYNKNLFPYPGTYMDQPAAYMTAMKIIEREYYEQLKDRRKRGK